MSKLNRLFNNNENSNNRSSKLSWIFDNNVDISERMKKRREEYEQKQKQQQEALERENIQKEQEQAQKASALLKSRAPIFPNADGTKPTVQEASIENTVKNSGDFWENVTKGREKYDIQHTGNIGVTNDEAEIYSYLYGKYGKDRANKYLSDIKPRINERKSEQQLADLEKRMREDKGTAIAYNMLGSLGGGLGLVETGAQAIKNAVTGRNDTVDPNAAGFAWAKAQKMSEEILNEGKGTAGQLLTGTGLSMGQNLTSRLATGAINPALSLWIMASNAAGRKALDNAEKGISAGKSLGSSAVSGGIEYFTEKLPFDNLSKMMKVPTSTAKEIVTNILKQAAEEGGEELVSEYANNIADIAILGNQSDYEQYKQELINSGMTTDEAAKKANKQFYAINPALSFAGGALSGVGFGTGGSVLGNIGTRNVGKQIRGTNGGENIINWSQSERYAGTQAQEYGKQLQQKKADTGSEPSNAEIGRLYNMINIQEENLKTKERNAEIAQGLVQRFDNVVNRFKGLSDKKNRAETQQTPETTPSKRVRVNTDFYTGEGELVDVRSQNNKIVYDVRTSNGNIITVPNNAVTPISNTQNQEVTTQKTASETHQMENAQNKSDNIQTSAASSENTSENPIENTDKNDIINNIKPSVVGGQTQWETPLDTSTRVPDAANIQQSEDFENQNTESVSDVIRRYRLAESQEPETVQDVLNRYKNTQPTESTSQMHTTDTQRTLRTDLPRQSVTPTPQFVQRVTWRSGSDSGSGVVVGTEQKNGTEFVKVQDDSGNVKNINPMFVKSAENPPVSKQSVDDSRIGRRASWNNGVTNGSGEIVDIEKRGNSDMYVIRTEDGKTTKVNGKYAEIEENTNTFRDVTDTQADTISNAENRTDTDNNKKISKSMSDEERFNILKNKSLDIVSFNEEKLSSVRDLSIDELKNSKIGAAKPILKTIAEQFDIIGKTYENADIELDFKYSNRSFNESVQKQHTNYDNFAKMLSVFDEVIANAVGIEAHNDRYKGTSREDAHNINNYVLVSAFADKDGIVPVRMLVKEFDDKANSLRMTVSLNKIEDSLHTQTPTNKSDGQKYAPLSSNISLSDFFAKVNPADGDFLKYVPDGFLNDEQKTSKQEAIGREEKYIEQYKKIKQEAQSNVHNGLLDGESESDNGGREPRDIQKAQEKQDIGAENRKLGENVAGTNGEYIQNSEAEASSTEQLDSRDRNDGIREPNDSKRNSGTGIDRDDNVDVDNSKDNKSKDFVITKAVAESIDTSNPSIEDNIKAIETLHAIENSGKSPTKAQQGLLARFKGWGGLKNAFFGTNLTRLKGLMSENEIKAAQSTVNDAYFTPTNIIDAVYKCLNHLGFEGGNILEPSMGIGNFFGRMPKSVKDNSTLFGVEIDTVSGRIAKQLYPSASIEIAPFQDVAYKDGAFDLIVGNVPFGEVKYNYKGKKYLIHDYFFVKAMDKLNDGGILAFLTTKGTLDKINGTVRNELKNKGRMIAAFRLPSNVFSDSASANVVTDLIIMQKTADTDGEKFVNLSDVSVGNNTFSINEYFANHPENIIGELTSKRDYRSGKEVLDVKANGNVSEQLIKAIKKLPKNLLSDVQTVGKVDVMDNTSKKQTFVVADNGNVEYIETGTGEVKSIKGKNAQKAKAYIDVKNAYQELTDATLNNAEQSVIDEKRKNLNAVYDGFVKKHGTLEKNKKILSADNDFYKVSGLEIYDTKSKKIIKSEVFSKDTLSKKKPKSADNVLDALSISIGETGGVDLKRISELTGLSEKEAIEQLDDRIVYTPDGTYEISEVYLSGDVRAKYEAVKGKKGFEKNEKMLKAVIPEDIPAKNITPQFGSPWIGPKYVSQFLKETFDLFDAPKVSYDNTSGTWFVDTNTQGDYTLLTNKYGTKRMSALKIAESALNMRTIVVKDKYDDKTVVNVVETRAAQQKAEDIKAAFEEWCFKDAERRKDLVDIFNRKFNSNRNMDFSELSKYLTFDGLSDTFKLRDYQKRAVARAVFNGNTLLAHGVGTGKTAEMITIAMELKRMGMAKKNMMVVPGHKVADFRNDILKMYPSAKVAMLEKGANPVQRQKFYALVASNDFDIVLIPHSSFGLIDVSNDTKKAFIISQIDELEEALTTLQNEKGKIDGRFISALEKAKKILEENLKKITESPKDNGNTFEELGVDSLFVDEAHNFKNLPINTKLSRVAGVSMGTRNNKTRASRAENMFMITDYLNKNGGRITFGTATPITKSLTEIYNMIRFLRPDILENAGLRSFDAWASMFGSIVNQAEVDPTGRKMRMKERFSKFKNVSQMIEQFRRVADILKTGDVVAELPEVEYIQIENESNQYQDEFLDILDEIVSDIQRSGQKGTHNMLEVTTAGQMAAVDLRFVASYFKGKYTIDDLTLPNCRTAQVAKNVYKEYVESNDRKGTQFVFCDVGVYDNPDKKYGFHVYGDIINKLVSLGIPRNEIAVAQDFEDKADLSARVNTGEIRVLIGSTAVMGEGMNAQNKAVALHHVTAPANPADIEQREGRIIRYGNENKNVRIYRYIQKKSYDSYQWQMLERKASFINQALSGGTVEELEEMSDFQLTAREAKAIASGNPLLLEKIEVEDKLNKLKSIRNKFNTEKLEMKDRLAALPNMISKKQAVISKTTADVQTVSENKTKDFNITIDGKTFTERTKAAEVLKKVMEKVPHNGTRVNIGAIRGLDIFYTSSFEKGNNFILKGSGEYIVASGDSAVGNITRIANQIDKIGENIETDKAIVEKYKAEMKTIKTEINSEFPQAKELDELQTRLNNINTQLGINVEEVDVGDIIAEDEDTETDNGETVHYSLGGNNKSNTDESPENETGNNENTENSEIEKSKSDNSDSTSKKKSTEPSRPIHQIIKEVSDRLRLPVGTGKITNRNANGIFKEHANVIRLRIANDLPIFAHELGHYFDSKYNFSELSEINEVISNSDNEFLEQYPESEHASEAFAEFMRVYLLNREAARRTFPKFSAEFENIIRNTEDFDTFDKAAHDMNQYMTQGVLEKMSAAMATEKDAEKLYKLTTNETMEKRRMEWVDAFAPIERAAKFASNQLGQKLYGAEDAYTLATNSLNAQTKTANILKVGLFDINGHEIGNSFFECLSGINAKDTDDFQKYLIARHAPYWLRQDMRVYADDDLNDIETMEKVRAEYEKKHPEFKEAAEKLYEFQRKVMQAYLVDTGIITQEYANSLWEKYPDYIPLRRVLGKNINKAKSTFANQNVPIRRAHGSGLAIISPLESIVSNTQKYVTAAMRNQTMQALAHYADTVDGFGEFMERVPPDMVRRVTNITEHREGFAQNLDELFADESAEIMNAFDDVFGNEIISYDVGRQRRDIVTVLRNGEKQYYQVHDRNFLEAIAELTPKDISNIDKFCGNIMNATKVLQTSLNYVFGIRNPMRDIKTGYSNSIVTSPFEYAKLLGSAFMDVVTKSNDYRQFIAMGGGHSSELAANMDQIQYIMRKLAKKDRAGLLNYVKAVLGHPKQSLVFGAKDLYGAVTRFSDLTETVPRFAEFKAAKARGFDNQQAIYNADKVTTNFKRAGTKGRRLNKFYMYFNASVQGLDVFYGNIKSKPLQQILKYLIPSILSMLVIQFWNRYFDKDGWENLSQYTKNNYYCYSLGGNGKFVKIPKAREAAVFDSFAERVWDSIADGDMALWRDFAGYAAENLLPNIVPTAWITEDELPLFESIPHEVFGNMVIGPFVDSGFNRDFKGSPIVSRTMENQPKREQYTGRTSFIAVQLGKILNQSPLKIDHIIKSSTGILGTINSAWTAVEKSERKLIPGLSNSFTADANYSTDIINRAYTKKDKAVDKFTFNKTSENGMEAEKQQLITSYISGMTKVINSLPYEQQSTARGQMLENVKNMQQSSGIAADTVTARFGDALPEDFILTKLPSSTLERTQNKVKQTYQLSPDEYNQMINEILSEVTKIRQNSLPRSGNAADDKVAKTVLEQISKRISDIKDKYKKKHSKEFTDK